MKKEFKYVATKHPYSKESVFNKRPQPGWKMLKQVQHLPLINNNGCNNGFTLIELLVVVLIIGILAAVSLPQYQKAVEKSHATEVLAQLKTLAQAEYIYFLANGKYTDQWDELDVGFSGTPQGIYMLQKNWYLALKAEQEQRIFAARMYKVATAEEERYYFNYYLDSGLLICEARDNVKSQERCKQFSTEEIACPTPSSHICYKIN